MNISVSSILAAIVRFEQEFEMQVFVRRRAKGLSLTAAGEQAMVRTIRLLADTEAFVQDLRGPDGGMTGEVRVGCFTSIAPNIAPQVIHELSAAYPSINAHLIEGDIITIQKLLRDATVDLLLTYDTGLSDEFDVELLAVAPPHVVVAEVHRLARPALLTLKDLSHHPLLLLNLPQSRNYVLSLFESAGVQPGPIQRLESFEMVRGAAAAGLGLAVLNIRPLSDLTYSGMRVACRPLAVKAPVPNLVLATRRGGQISRRSEAFAACCRRYFGSAQARRLFLHAPDEAE